MSVVWDDRGGGGGGIAKARQASKWEWGNGELDWMEGMDDIGKGKRRAAKRTASTTVEPKWEGAHNAAGGTKASHRGRHSAADAHPTLISVHRSYGLGLLTKKRRY